MKNYFVKVSLTGLLFFMGIAVSYAEILATPNNNNINLVTDNITINSGSYQYNPSAAVVDELYITFNGNGQVDFQILEAVHMKKIIIQSNNGGTVKFRAGGNFPYPTITYCNEECGIPNAIFDNTVIVIQCSPTITLSETSLSNLDYFIGSGPSLEKTFTAAGSNLNADIILSAPSNFEISESPTSGFGSSITLTQSDGVVNTSSIYVRLTSNLPASTYTGVLSVTSNGATQKEVSLSGHVTTILEDFNDGNFTDSPVWSGSTSSFSVITDATLPRGNASTDGSYLASNPNQGHVSLAIPSTEVSEWMFSLGSGSFTPKDKNHLGVVLMADAFFEGDLLTADFNGYYLRIGKGGDNDPLELYRKDGSDEVRIGEFESSPDFQPKALSDGLNVKITRNSSGQFELFYSTGFDYSTSPTNSAGTLTDNTYSVSTYFGVYQIIGNTSNDKRRVYIDNIVFGTLAPVRWKGDDETSPNSWLEANNWDTGVIPNTDSDVIIPAGLTNYPTVDTDVTINSLTIATGATLIANNNFNVNSVNYSRELVNAGQWYLMSSPVVDEYYDDAWVTANSIASGTNNNRGIGTYNNSMSNTTSYWQYMQAGSSSSFETGRGYSILRTTAGSVTFNGNGIHTTDQSFELVQGENNYNLVGNPFTAYISLKDFYDANINVLNTASRTVWFWNGSSYDSKTSNLFPDFKIAPGQAFFVEADVDEQNISFSAAHRKHNSSDTFQRNLERPEINVFISDENQSRYTNIYYIDGTTTGHDSGFDATLYGGSSQSFELYSHILNDNVGNKYQLQSLPNNDYSNMVIPIGVTAQSGTYTFTMNTFHLPADYKVFLEDKETNNFVRLDEVNSSYEVTFNEAISGVGRVYLHTTTEALSTNELNLNHISIYTTTPQNLRITGVQSANAKVSIFNILGAKVMSSQFEGNGMNDIPLPEIKTGIYVIQLETEIGSLNKKIIIK